MINERIRIIYNLRSCFFSDGMRLVLLTVLFGLPLSLAEFTPHFRKFLHDNYGVGIASMLERTDLGLDTALGGKLNDEDDLKNQAVIIVHGITNKILRFKGTIDFLNSKGYKSAEVYGTTWGDGGITPVGLVDMKCSYVKQIRRVCRALIIAVRQYTGTQVDVIAYSMGAPIARKAILGGQCVDTREILGRNARLTDFNSLLFHKKQIKGNILLKRQRKWQKRRYELVCCLGYLEEIIYFLVQIGFRTCGKPVSPIRGGNGYVKKEWINHDQLMDGTLHLQRNFITKHTPV
uniref:Triacylglycerol lipase n=1 Tax=Heterorhabditis bacteriophora TaxID=37862 RepID=A0A1I7WBU8_HETBA